MEVIDLTDDRPSKRKCTFVDEDDLDWLKGELEDIRDTMDHFSRELDFRFAKVVRKVQQLS
jgi:inorganic pyrophosphatase